MKTAILAGAFLLVTAIGLRAQETVFHQEVTWSPDGQFISFSVYRRAHPEDKQLIYEIYVIRPDGRDLRKVVDNATWSSWSKDGKRILFSRTSADRKSSDIFSGRLDGSDLVQLTHDTKRNSHPAFSPNGKWIVFTSTRDAEKYQIYVMDSKGQHVRRLTNDPNVGFYNPLWSPDSKTIVYYAEKGDQKDQVWTVRADGTESKLLTGNIGHNTFPSFTSDGRSILFNSTRDNGQRGMYTMRAADGTNMTALTAINGNIARYSPNGKWIAYTVGGFPQNNIFVARSDGSGAVKIH